MIIISRGVKENIRIGRNLPTENHFNKTTLITCKATMNRPVFVIKPVCYLSVSKFCKSLLKNDSGCGEFARNVEEFS